jgi:hypothetical protein
MDWWGSQPQHNDYRYVTMLSCPPSHQLTGLGTFILGLAEGLEPTIQGLAVLSADANAYGRLFTLIAVIDETATLISRPMMGLIFAASQDIGGLGRGLVFVVAAVSSLFVHSPSVFY